MNAETTYVNEFTARGIVLSIGRSTYHKRVLTLLVQERRNKVLKLEINLEDGVGKRIDTKDRVIVTGYIRGFNYHNDALGKDSEVMFFVGTDVKRETTELSKRFGGKIGTFYPEHVFRSFVSGKVVNIVLPTDKIAWAKLVVKTNGGGSDMRASSITLRYYTNGHLPIFDYQIGDVICCRLSAYTPEKKLPDGTTRIFQNVNVEDIAYLYKAPRAASRNLKFDVDAGLIVNNNIPTEQKPAPVDSEVDEAEIYADDTDLINRSL